MLQKSNHINPSSLVTEIVVQNHRTAEVFRNHEIDYCCGGRWPLETVAKNKGIELAGLVKELENASRTFTVSPTLPRHDWHTDFIVDFILNVHHRFVNGFIPTLRTSLLLFKATHEKKYPHLGDIIFYLNELETAILPQMKYEEEIIFPYVRQVTHAYEGKESFGKLLVKTLRKPLHELLRTGVEVLTTPLHQLRDLTSGYQIPADACISYQVILSSLKDLDTDMAHHIFLENDILYPRIIAFESELLQG
jgi:regulator of cell morphogenesis and NO signaling